MLVVVVPVAGKPFKKEIHDEYTHHGLQALVGGFIEVVRASLLPDDWVMVIDEEGKLKGKAVNRLGSILYDNPIDVIVGDLVLIREGMVDSGDGYMEPDLVGLTDSEADDCISRFIPAALRYSGML